MISPACLQCPPLDLFPSIPDLLCTPEVEIGRCQIVQRLMVLVFEYGDMSNRRENACIG